MSVIIQRLSLPVIVTQMEQLVARKKGRVSFDVCFVLLWFVLGFFFGRN